MADTITLPFFNLGDDHAGVAFASDEKRLALLEKLFVQEGHSFDELPAAYANEGPLARWCWLVLTVNGIEIEYTASGAYFPLTHYGIDLAFSTTDVRRWVFALA